MVQHKILVLDFGSPSAQLVARRVREQQVYCELHPHDVSDHFVRDFGAHGIILTGGPDAAYEAGHGLAPEAVFQLGVPVLAIGHGALTMVQQLGGRIETATQHAYRQAELRARGHSRLLADIEDRSNAEGHGLLDVCLVSGARVPELPAGFKLIGSEETTPIAALADEERGFYGLLFHPELPATTKGPDIFARFVHELCGCDHGWNMPAYIEQAVAKIRSQVGGDEVILGLSGGVDSAVTAALIHRAIGDQLTCVFVDHGLLRLNEGKMVLDMFAGRLHARVVHVDASEQFLRALAGVSDPEAKRKIIGHEFVEVFQAEARKRVQAKWLAQGTIYPDVIESGANTKGKVIKSHHNVGGLPETLGLKLLEPLRDLFKDEVRQLGVALGLPPEMVYRHPFPGPGLGVRILGEVKKEYADLLRQADHIFIEELRGWIDAASGKNWYELSSQAFAVFVPVRSVGVVNNERRYAWVVSLRAVETVDFMTARWAHLPYALIDKVSTRIITEIEGISRVVYDVSSKPPATIEWE